MVASSPNSRYALGSTVTHACDGGRCVMGGKTFAPINIFHQRGFSNPYSIAGNPVQRNIEGRSRRLCRTGDGFSVEVSNRHLTNRATRMNWVDE